MKPKTILGILRILLVVVSLSAVFSVFVAGYDPGGDPHHSTPIVREAGAPAINATLGNATIGVFNLLYPNGLPVNLNNVEVDLRVCASTCTMVTATLTETAPGAIAYFIPIVPLTGAVTIILPAGSLTDSYGRSFPREDTIIGAYFASTGGTIANKQAGSMTSPQPWPGVLQQAQPVTGQTSTNAFQVELVLAVLILTLSTLGLLVLPSSKI